MRIVGGKRQSICAVIGHRVVTDRKTSTRQDFFIDDFEKLWAPNAID
jgi:hypothetical protein